MPIFNQDIGLVKMAELCGLKRRFFGLESKRSLAKRVVSKLQEQSPLSQLYEGLSKAFEPRVCVREEFTEAAGVYIGENEQYPYVLKEWDFHYSDGTTETVTSRERVE